MKICMLAGGLDPLLPEPIGAIEPYVFGLSKELSLKNKVNLIGYGKGWVCGQNLSIKALLGNSKVLRLTSNILGQNLGYGLFFNVHAMPEVNSLCRKRLVDIIHIHTPYNTITASTMKLKYNVPFVCSLHNGFRTAFPLKLCDKILTNSQFLKSYLTDKKGIDSNRIAVLPIAVDTRLLMRTKDKLALKKEVGLQDYNVLLFVGRKVAYKGPQFLLGALPQIVKRHPKTIAFFIGPDISFNGNLQTCTNSLKALAKSLGIEKNVSFMGFTPDSVVRQYYGMCDVFVFPSTWQEPFGKGIIEAMSYETPVVASNVGGIPEIIIDGINGLLVPPSDTDALATSINYLLEHPAVSQTLGQNGRITVQEKYTFKVVSEMCSEIYANLC